MTVDVTSEPRKARLYVSRIDPWSIFKAAFMLALALGIVIVVAVAVLWWVLDYAGVFVTVSSSINDVVGSATANFDLVSLLDFSRVMGVAVVVAAVEVVLVSIIATLFAFIYNLSVGLTGGVEVVLTDQN
ncbi:MAG: hypothetical protein F2889_00230 [Actinobacteria bacterium]|nr:hypothetical protein [Actinomycetota bacterium]